MRSLVALAFALALTACVDSAEPEPHALRATTSAPDSLLARLDANELAEALDRLQQAGYTAQVTVHEITGDLGARTFEQTVFEQTIEVSGDSVRVVQTSGSDEDAFAVFDPVARLLPKEPPFRNPATRGMYALERGALRGSVASATAERREGSDPISRAEVAVDTATGQVVSAHVWRESQSAVFDETSEATLRMTRLDDAWWPSHGHLVTDIDVPLSDAPRRVLEWRVLSIGGVELAADSTAG